MDKNHFLKIINHLTKKMTIHFEKSKCLIEMKTKYGIQYLLGFIHDNEWRHTVLGGTKDEEDRTPIDTLFREFYEETTGILKLDVDLKTHEYCLIDIFGNSIPLHLNEIIVIEDSRYYYLFVCEDKRLMKNMRKYNEKLEEAQNEIYDVLIHKLHELLDKKKIDIEQLNVFLQKYRKQRYTKSKEFKFSFQTYFKNYNISEEILQKAIQMIESVFVVMEVDQLVFATKEEMEQDHFVYEREIISYLK